MARLRLPRGAAAARFAVVLVAAAALGWLTVSVGTANMFRRLAPDLALRLAPYDARAQARAAEVGLAQNWRSAAARAAAAEQSRQALERDATIAPAWRNLGMGAALGGSNAGAARLFGIAERISQRDLPTRLWLIDERVRRNDIPGALREYDAALRISTSSHELLLPILVSALDQPQIVRPLAELIGSDPPWQRFFFRKLAETPPDGANVATLLETSARRGVRPEPDLLARLVAALAGKGDYEAALRIYRLAAGRGPAGPALVRNGDFARPNPLPPFDWQLRTEGGLNPEQGFGATGADGAALIVESVDGADGLAARQLLLLAPGSYVLSGLAGAGEASNAPGQLVWTLTCVGPPQTRLLELALEPQARAQPWRGTFRVPAGCAAQWLDLQARPAEDAGTVSQWVDSIAVRPASGSGS